jgi:hypothetical protein
VQAAENFVVTYFSTIKTGSRTIQFIFKKEGEVKKFHLGALESYMKTASNFGPHTQTDRGTRLGMEL